MSQSRSETPTEEEHPAVPPLSTLEKEWGLIPEPRIVYLGEEEEEPKPKPSKKVKKKKKTKRKKAKKRPKKRPKKKVRKVRKKSRKS